MGLSFSLQVLSFTRGIPAPLLPQLAGFAKNIHLLSCPLYRWEVEFTFPELSYTPTLFWWNDLSSRSFSSSPTTMVPPSVPPFSLLVVFASRL